MTKLAVTDKVNVKMGGTVAQGEITAIYLDGLIDVTLSEPLIREVDEVQEPYTRKGKGLHKSRPVEVQTTDLEKVPHSSSPDVPQKDAGQSVAVWYCRNFTEEISPVPEDPEFIEVQSS